MDLKDGPTGNLAWLTALPWSGQAAFAEAPRTVWRADNYITALIPL